MEQRLHQGLTPLNGEQIKALRKELIALRAQFDELGVNIPIRTALQELTLAETKPEDFSLLALSLALKEIFNRVETFILRFELSEASISRLEREILQIQIDLNLALQTSQGPPGPPGPIGLQERITTSYVGKTESAIHRSREKQGGRPSADQKENRLGILIG
ncbi:hypothetical protein J4772_13880 [Cohnella sp. LGH]|uniref:hypothetical protein n=1 Tax=Cohnella sp. LGH TaxID=1619153 RepID=UPI001ADAB7D9|nr:hypothetical protein [Cohnella sp. LGH]QTH45399.1 hypothetical protein J4772_13880 [Cohnella sp. LGH]